MPGAIGLIGGMSWESTATYYREINEMFRLRKGGLTSAEILMHSVDFTRIVEYQKSGRWDLAAEHLSTIGRHLADGGATCIVICTNTMHIVADEVAKRLPVPLLNIIDVTGEALLKAGVRKPLLLATKYTMEQGFYIERMMHKYGIDPIVPEAADRDLIHHIIFDELCQGIISEKSRERFLELIAGGLDGGADSVILGCTEIGLLIGPNDTEAPTFDSTRIHAESAVNFVERRSPSFLI